MKQLCAKYALGVIVFTCSVMSAALADQRIVVQSTTSTKNSGLYDYILPLMKKDTGVTAHVVARAASRPIWPAPAIWQAGATWM